MGEKPEIRFQQLYDIQYNSPPYCIDFDPVGKNIRKWKATIIGPQHTPFENGKFKLSIDIPSNFLKKPPKVTFDTKIYHPNIAKATFTLTFSMNKIGPVTIPCLMCW